MYRPETSENLVYKNMVEFRPIYNAYSGSILGYVHQGSKVASHYFTLKVTLHETLKYV